MSNTTTILFLAAEPSDLAKIKLRKELREIENILRRSKLKDRFRIEKRFAVQAETFTQAVLELQPAIVHFSGHGPRRGFAWWTRTEEH